MAFLGIASPVGVIVSHVIVLFDFIEEMHAKGKPFETAVIDVGIIRLGPGSGFGVKAGRGAWRRSRGSGLNHGRSRNETTLHVREHNVDTGICDE